MPTRPDKSQPDRMHGRFAVSSLEGDQYSELVGWETIALEDPDFISRALIKAHQLRGGMGTGPADPGDAYLRGVFDLRARQLLNETGATFNAEDFDEEARFLISEL